MVEWDRQKADVNRSRHGVDFSDAVPVLTDDQGLTRPDDDPDEERYVTIGMDALGRILVVVYVWRGDQVRMISARRATSHERWQYSRLR